MAIEQWLPLTDYASKYRISVSTLRRRIKNEQIKHRFDEGKYMLLDLIPDQLDHGFLQQQPLEPVLTPISAAQFLRNLGFTKPQQEFDVAKALDSEPVFVKMDSQPLDMTTHESKMDIQPQDLDSQSQQVTEELDSQIEDVDSQIEVAGEAVTTQNTEEPLLTSATRLLSELKRAYMNILQEKEESIIQLKEEVSDLKTLVRVLEDDNERMRKFFDPPR